MALCPLHDIYSEKSDSSESVYTSEEELSCNDKDVMVLYVRNGYSLETILNDKESSKELNSYIDSCKSNAVTTTVNKDDKTPKTVKNDSHSHIVVNLKLLKEMYKKKSKESENNVHGKNNAFIDNYKKFEKYDSSKLVFGRCQQKSKSSADSLNTIKIRKKLEGLKNELENNRLTDSSHIRNYRKRLDELKNELKLKEISARTNSEPQFKKKHNDILICDAVKTCENNLKTKQPRPEQDTAPQCKKTFFSKFNEYVKKRLNGIITVPLKEGSFSSYDKKRAAERKKSIVNISESNSESESIYEDEHTIKCCKYSTTNISPTRNKVHDKIIKNSTAEKFRQLKSLERMLTIYETMRRHALLERSSAGASNFIVNRMKNENLIKRGYNEKYPQIMKNKAKNKNVQIYKQNSKKLDTHRTRYVSFAKLRKIEGSERSSLEVFHSTHENPISSDESIHNKRIKDTSETFYKKGSGAQNAEWQQISPSITSEECSFEQKSFMENTSLDSTDRETVKHLWPNRNQCKKKFVSPIQSTRKKHSINDEFEWIVRRVKKTAEFDSSETSLNSEQLAKKEPSYILGRFKTPPPVPYYKKNFTVQKVRKFKNTN